MNDDLTADDVATSPADIIGTEVEGVDPFAPLNPFEVRPRRRDVIKEMLRRQAARLTAAARSLVHMVWWAAGNAFTTVLASVAVVSTTAVALTMWGSAQVLDRGVDAALARWRGGVEMIVFFDPAAPASTLAAAGGELGSDPRVASARLVDQQATWEEFVSRFDSELGDVVRPQDLPASWRVVPAAEVDGEMLGAMAADWRQRDQVFDVVTSDEALVATVGFTTDVSTGLQVVAWVVAVMALVLTVSASSTSARSRREELAVLQAAGVAPWVLRIPFVLEGALRGVVASVAATAAVWWVRDLLVRHLQNGDTLEQLQGFNVSDVELATILVTMSVVGVTVATVTSWMASRRWTTGRTSTMRWRAAVSALQGWLTVRWWNRHRRVDQTTSSDQPAEKSSPGVESSPADESTVSPSTLPPSTSTPSPTAPPTEIDGPAAADSPLPAAAAAPNPHPKSDRHQLTGTG